MAGAVTVYRWESLPREEVRPGVTRTAFRGENAMMVMNWLEPGMEKRPVHTRSNSLLSSSRGGCASRSAKRWSNEAPGEVVRIPPDVVHCGEALGNEVALNLDVFAPLREDYLHLTAYHEADFG